MGCVFSGPVGPAPNESAIDNTHFNTSRLVGKGGFGEVRLATKLTGADEGTTYAMKIYKKRGLLKNSNGVQEVVWELSVLATLNTPWLCNARYAFQDEAHCYLVMDLALGGDLKYHLAEEEDRHFAEERSRIYLAQIYLALEYLHSRRILHRDLKPANVVLDADGYIKVTDMGISSHLDTNGNSTKNTGTPGFIAPELYRKSREHSFPSDWWSYGILAHHLLTGRAPYKPHAFEGRRLEVDTAALEKDVPSFPTPTLYFTEGGVLWKKNCGTVREANGADGVSGGKGEGEDPAAAEAGEEELRRERSVEVSPECALFVGQLLQKNPANRLGAKSSQEVKNHPFFAGFDWEALKARTLPVPFVPDTTKDNFSNDEEMMAALFGVDKGDDLYVVPEKKRQKFKHYHFNTVLQPELGTKKMDGPDFFKARLKKKFPTIKFSSRRKSSLRLPSSLRLRSRGSKSTRSGRRASSAVVAPVQEAVQPDEENEEGDATSEKKEKDHVLSGEGGDKEDEEEVIQDAPALPPPVDSNSGLGGGLVVTDFGDNEQTDVSGAPPPADPKTGLDEGVHDVSSNVDHQGKEGVDATRDPSPVQQAQMLTK